MQITLPKASQLPKDFKYPDAFLKTVRLHLVDFDIWNVMNGEQVLQRLKGLQERYPNRILIPFARRMDNDDLACFEVGKTEEIQIVHDFSSPGYEQRKSYMTFWDWFKDAIDEMIDFE
ncbi:hypothetical protein BBD42_02130 [Paenibacillus sp. BIHB 4019]|uniref:Uncharacterized protein n=1 Tax=Paenibacillus sp. BIHB 4019 TaxID=1870819 RepID=A0A1B2DCG5_9BACL|nr:hypothetical protein [Paenibacillus sp. BIHB 4019]ANY65401.1 hypothetical protein BBD42_02130 [Paenibacillus sp. BIHB 4019]